MAEQHACTLQQCSFDLAHERALFEIVSNIRKSIELDEIIQTTIKELRQLLAADRVGVVRLDVHQGWDDGIFIAESVQPQFDAVLSKQVHDHCFGQQYADAYRDGRIQALDDIYEAGLSPCHIEILSQFQVRANLLVPLLKGTELWGLLCVHQCSGPRHWQADEIEFVSKIAMHLSVAIDHAELLTKTQQQASELEATLRSLKSTQTQLAQSEKMSSLGQLAAGLAHEINNPVNFISANLNHVEHHVRSLLTLVSLYQEHFSSGTSNSSSIPEIEAAEEDLDADFLLRDLPNLCASMKAGSVRISYIVEALRNFSRLDEVGFKKVRIEQGIDTALLLLSDRLRPTQHRPKIQIQKRYHTLPIIECSPGKINQVVMSLLTNAVDAIDEAWAQNFDNIERKKPLIAIDIADSAKGVRIDISDNGLGIPEAIQTKLYDPFFTTKPIGKGTGLGLAISRQIVTNHHGELLCESQTGRGTTFSIELPNTQTMPSS